MGRNGFWSAVGLCIVACAGLAACNEDELVGKRDSASISYEVIAVGDSGPGGSGQQFRLIESQAELEEVFSALSQNTDALLPVVDFDHEVAYLAAAGWLPSTGYGISVERLRHIGLGAGVDGLAVDVRISRPGTGCVVGFSITAPYVMISFPRSELGSGVVSVDVSEHAYKCN